MELKQCSMEFLADDKKRKNKMGKVKNNFNNRSFLSVFNETVKENGKFMFPQKEKVCKLQPKKQDADKKIERNKIIGHVKSEMRKRIKSAISKIANFLGIGENWLMLIFESAGIEPEDLIDEEKKDLAFIKLVKFLQLSEEKSRKLKKVFETL